MNGFLPEFLAQLPLVLAFVTFRVLPFAAYACAAARVPLSGKLLALASYAGLVAAQRWLEQPLDGLLCAALATLYFAALVPALRWVRNLLAARVVGKPVVFALCAGTCLVLPSVISPPELVAVAAVLGWEKMLSAYSYCVDTAESGERDALSETAFFLLVNPILVYQERGRRVAAPDLPASASLRLGQALTGLYLRAALVALLPALAIAPGSEAALAGIAQSGAYHTLQLAILYLAHSSLAGLQIGAMRLLGHEISECYRAPFAATSPLEFWRRWNIWVGRWVLRYLFNPAALALRRRYRARPKLATSIALLLTFLGVGFLHDLYFVASQLRASAQPWSFALTVAFGAFALVLLAWTALQQAAAPAFERWDARTTASRPARAALWVASMLVLVASASASSRELLDPLLARLLQDLLS